MEKNVNVKYFKDEYTTTELESYLKNVIKVNYPIFIKQHPYVGEDGIYVPCEEYVEEGCAANYKCIITKEMFIEAYNKWIGDSER